jgi:hypothetical protein
MRAPDDLPGWVPAAVKQAVERVLRLEARSAGQKALVRRLVADERMHKVWHKLARHPVSPKYRDGGLRLTMPDDTDTDGKPLALAMVFYSAYTLADVPLEVETVAERTARLRGDLRAIAGKPLVEALKLTVALGRYSRNELRDIEDVDHRWVVARNYGDRRERQYALALTRCITDLFGKPMPATVATVASVALQKNIEMRRVKDWWELAHRRPA